MTVSLTNSVDIVVNSIGLLQADGIQDIAQTLQFLEGQLDGKPSKSDVYMRSATYSASQVEGRLLTKQNILSVADDSFTAPLINDSTNTIKCLATTSPLTYTDDGNKVTVNLDKTS